MRTMIKIKDKEYDEEKIEYINCYYGGKALRYLNIEPYSVTIGLGDRSDKFPCSSMTGAKQIFEDIRAQLVEGKYFIEADDEHEHIYNSKFYGPPYALEYERWNEADEPYTTFILAIAKKGSPCDEENAFELECYPDLYTAKRAKAAVDDSTDVLIRVPRASDLNPDPVSRAFDSFEQI